MDRNTRIERKVVSKMEAKNVENPEPEDYDDGDPVGELEGELEREDQ